MWSLKRALGLTAAKAGAETARERAMQRDAMRGRDVVRFMRVLICEFKF
jgi:hypothetical protein